MGYLFTAIRSPFAFIGFLLALIGEGVSLIGLLFSSVGPTFFFVHLPLPSQHRAFTNVLFLLPALYDPSPFVHHVPSHNVLVRVGRVWA